MHGTTRMRTQVEVDPGIGMRGFEAVQSLIADYSWAIDIEMCVFPQEGLTNYPGTDELLVEGLKRGAKVIGGAPRYDTNGPARSSASSSSHASSTSTSTCISTSAIRPTRMDIHLVRELTEHTSAAAASSSATWRSFRCCRRPRSRRSPASSQMPASP